MDDEGLFLTFVSCNKGAIPKLRKLLPLSERIKAVMLEGRSLR